MNSQKVQWGWVLVLAVTCGFWWETAGPVFSLVGASRRGHDQGFQVRDQAGGAPPRIPYSD